MHRRAWIAFLLVSLMWGMPYLFIKLAVHDVSPLFLAWSRVLLGAVVVAPLAWRMGAFRGLIRYWPGVVAYAALEIAIPFALIPIGELSISSSLTAIVISCMPLLVALLALCFGVRERLTPVRAVGLAVGLAGVVLLMGVNLALSPGEVIGVVLVGAATLCYAASPIIVARYLRGLHPLGPVSAALVFSALALTPFGIATRPVAMPSATAWAAIAVLGVVCTAAALVLYFYLVTEAGPGRASIITYLNPAVAVVLGVLVLREAVSLLTVAELLLIVAGSWLSTDGRLPPGAVRRVRALRALLRARPRAGGTGSPAVPAPGPTR